MRLRIATAALLLPFVITLPALAADGLSGMGANLFGNYFHFGRPNLDRPAVEKITVGGQAVRLQYTRLGELKKMFGGTIRTQGEGAQQATWLCYHTDTADSWFVSNAIGGQDFVMIVAVQAAGAKMPGDCDAAPKKFTDPDLGIPGLGATTADLKAAFGNAFGSKIAYRADVPAADALGTANTAQYIGYVLKGGKVTGYGAGETSVQNIR